MRQEPSMRPVIELHIEELVLHGFRPHDRHAIGDALELELTVLLSRPATLAALSDGRELDRLDAGTVQLQAGAGASTIGRQVASAIDGGLRR